MTKSPASLQRLTSRREWLVAGCGLILAPNAWATGNTSEIHSEHPRLFFRRQPWGDGGLTLAEVRRRGRAFADSLGPGRQPPPEGAPNLAMRYVITGEEEWAQQAIEQMKRGYSRDGEWTTTQGDQIEAIAIGYDWLRGAYENFTETDQRAVQQMLIDGAEDCRRRLGSGSSIYHTRMYAWANAVLFAGLALHGDRPEAADFIDFGIRYYRERLIPARRHMAGAWFNALSYGKKYMCRSVFSCVTAWRSASGENLWEQARRHENDWLGQMLLYLMYTLRPDHRYAIYGDIFDSMWPSNRGTMRVVAQATAETRDPFGQGFLRELKQHWGGPTYETESTWYQVFEDPSIPARPRSELPLSRLFSRDGLGAVVMRSGWGPDDTWILFKCGDYGDNHGHFDQGHFEIFRHGSLALDSFYGAKTTEFHNTILVSDPNDPADTGIQRQFSRQSHGTFAAYRADPVVETGDILGYRETGDTTYVLGDVSAAYPREKVHSFTRQVVFLNRSEFIVFDRVEVTVARYRPRWLLHYPSEPRIEGPRFSWTNGRGQLVVQTLLPRQARIVAAPYEKPPGRFDQSFAPKGRMEIAAPDADSNVTWFLHVLSPGAAGDAAPFCRLEEQDKAFVLRLRDAELAFDKNGRDFVLRPGRGSSRS